ncbi:MAG: hypothetical protein P8R54_32350 [Myxococcota bacterium]|nr:hypothetical protein [Myxococcota bacterium]
MLLIIVTLVGCAGETACAPGFTPSATGNCDPTPDDDNTTPAWTAAEAVSAIEALFAMGFTGPMELRAAYLERMSHGDELCPGSDVEISDSFVTGCTASSGYYFAGVSVYETMEWEGENSDVWAIGGDFEIQAPDGSQMLVGGHSFALYEDLQTQWFGGDITGSWSIDGAEGWLGEGISAMLLVNGMPSTSLDVTGGLGVGDTALFFPGLMWNDLDCPPAGEVQVRDSSGHWFDLLLPDDCTGCGTLHYESNGTVEDVCVDFGDIAWQMNDSLVPP